MARVRTGSIHKLKSGRWFARYTGPDGGRHGKAFLTKRDAMAWLQQIYSDISSGKFAPSDALVYRELHEIGAGDDEDLQHPREGEDLQQRVANALGVAPEG